MKIFLTTCILLTCSNLFSQNQLPGKTFTHSYPITTSVHIETLRFVNDSICMLTYGSLNVDGNSVTLKYSLVNDEVTFKNFQPIEGIRLTEKMKLMELNNKQALKLKKKKESHFKSEYWVEKSVVENKKSRLYLKIEK